MSYSGIATLKPALQPLGEGGHDKGKFRVTSGEVEAAVVEMGSPVSCKALKPPHCGRQQILS